MAGRRSGRARGFTLIEVMVVIALLGGLAAILSLGASRLLIERSESAEDVFWTVVGEVRKQALQKELDVRLSYDADAQAFQVVTAVGRKTYPVPLEERLELDFLGVEAGSQTILIGGTLVEANLLDHVLFFRDGTCLPFRARLTVGTRPAVILEIDPWTCAPVLRDEEERF